MVSSIQLALQSMICTGYKDTIFDSDTKNYIIMIKNQTQTNADSAHLANW